ncbi:response regulator [Thermosulfuriphilus ammonigenes]|uniref:Response regulator n=1 Tax=Thermosulfuriphilus ammonigenes TaxID=1936021 RepID=A0A6G7PTC3_9BACT|nr:response regulator [Thermosulfuriphilus ammonigenes]MBA2848957.1 CheY-like chemotaxis protein [Thermosulfuriphilus ammonigenes]QIJ70929.1 response regulator [Thermosulfuriphilus ammonigenes]
MIPSSLILLVEDDPNDVILIKRAFDRARIANPIQVAQDGEEAIAYLAGSEPYHDRSLYPLPMLVLLDLKMPRKSGFDVLAWIRAQEVLRRLPVVVLTSSKDTPDINRAYDLGANSYLVKPVAFEALIEMVKTLGLYWLILNQKPTLTPPE